MFRAIREYKIPIDGTAKLISLPVPTDPELVQRSDIQYRLRAKDADVLIKSGDATVVVVGTVDGNYARPDDTFSLGDGAIEMFKSKAGHTYLSVVSEDGSSEGYLNLTVGVGDV